MEPSETLAGHWINQVSNDTIRFKSDLRLRFRSWSMTGPVTCAAFEYEYEYRFTEYEYDKSGNH